MLPVFLCFSQLCVSLSTWSQFSFALYVLFYQLARASLSAFTHFALFSLWSFSLLLPSLSYLSPCFLLFCLLFCPVSSCFLPSPCPFLMSSFLFELSFFFPNNFHLRFTLSLAFLRFSVSLPIIFPFQYPSLSTRVSIFGLSSPIFPSLLRFLSSVSPHYFLPFDVYPSFLLSLLFLRPLQRSFLSFIQSSFLFSPSPSPNIPIRPILLLFRLCSLSPYFLHLFRIYPPFLSLDLCLFPQSSFSHLLRLSTLLSVFRSHLPFFSSSRVD